MGATLSFLQYPYKELQPATASIPPQGTVLLIMPDGPVASTQLRAWRRTYPSCALGVVVKCPTQQAAMDAASSLFTAGGYPCFADLPHEEQLRVSLTRDGIMPRAVTAWIRDAASDRIPLSEAFIEAIFNGPENVRDLATAAGETASREYRRRFKRAGTGSAANWFTVLRMLRAAVALQSFPRVSSAAIADRFGFFDPAHFRRRMVETFGASPSFIRDRVGWEWLMWTALRRSGLWGHAGHSRGN